MTANLIVTVTGLQPVPDSPRICKRAKSLAGGGEIHLPTGIVHVGKGMTENGYKSWLHPFEARVAIERNCYALPPSFSKDSPC